MALQTVEADAQLAHMQKIGQVWDDVYDGHRITQGYLAASERALGRVTDADIAAEHIRLNYMLQDAMGDEPDEQLAEAMMNVQARQRATASDDSFDAEIALDMARMDYAMRIGSVLGGRMVSVQILGDQGLRFQLPGRDHQTPMPLNLTGRFVGYEPVSTELLLDNEDDVFPVRLLMPDVTGMSRQLIRLANIMAVDFAADEPTD